MYISEQRCFRRTCCWVQHSPFLLKPITSFHPLEKRNLDAHRGVLLSSQRRVRAKCPVMVTEGGKEEEDSGKKDRDWDSSWTEFSKNRSGGVFELPDDRPTDGNIKVEDERVEKLTSAFSNETGFLLGIGVIALIAVFYGYVYASGGISPL